MIEIKHLKTLLALRNSGSLAAAAATLHQTQSALSHQFSDLEQRLGFRLFVRKSQPLRFTPQGEILLQLANQVLPQITQALQACHEPQQATLRIAIECACDDSQGVVARIAAWLLMATFAMLRRSRASREKCRSRNNSTSSEGR